MGGEPCGDQLGRGRDSNSNSDCSSGCSNFRTYATTLGRKNANARFLVLAGSVLRRILHHSLSKASVSQVS